MSHIVVHYIFGKIRADVVIRVDPNLRVQDVEMIARAGGSEVHFESLFLLFLCLAPESESNRFRGRAPRLV